VSDFISIANSRELPSYQNRKEFKFPATRTNSAWRALASLSDCRKATGPAPAEGLFFPRLLRGAEKASAGRDGDGWCGVVVSIEACGQPFLNKKSLGKRTVASQRKLQIALGPSSNLGTGPLQMEVQE